MKYLFYNFLVLLFFTLFSCQKKDGVIIPTYEVVFKKDGNPQSFAPYYSTIQPNGTMPNKTNFMFVAKSADKKHEFAITIQVEGNFKVGTYESGNNNYSVIADYFQNVGEQIERDFTIDHSPSMPMCSFIVTITSIDNNSIKGTFSGNYLYDSNYNEIIAISEGSFTVKK
jgi:hypothetical protein